jgi:hypothetical protein
LILFKRLLELESEKYFWVVFNSPRPMYEMHLWHSVK